MKFIHESIDHWAITVAVIELGTIVIWIAVMKIVDRRSDSKRDRS